MKHKNIKIKEENPILYCILVVIVFFIALKGSGWAISKIIDDADNYFAAFFITEAVTSAIAIFIVWYSGVINIFYRKGTGIGKGLFIGAYYVVMGTLTLIINLFLEEAEHDWQPWYSIVSFLLCMICVGIAEELIFRGVVAEILFHKFGGNKAGIWKAVFLSGIFFGVAHLSNIFNAAPIGVIVQVVSACISGMSFTAIYYRSGNIMVTILIHAYVDMASLVLIGLFGNGTIEGTISDYSFFNLIGVIPYILLVLFLLRNKKIEEIQKNMAYES